MIIDIIVNDMTGIGLTGDCQLDDGSMGVWMLALVLWGPRVGKMNGMDYVIIIYC